MNPIRPSSLLPSLGQNYRVVVIGATGGIGSAFCALLGADPACSEVIGLSRRSDPPIRFDDERSIEQAANHVAAISSAPLDLIIDATGLLSGTDGGTTIQPEKSLKAITPEAFARLFLVNVTGPALLLKHFVPLMRRDGRAVFATLSARVGSISDNGTGGWYGYRASKAALNMIVKTAAIEIARQRPQAIVLALHPGTVATSLSEPFAAGRSRLLPSESAARLLKVIDTVQETGQFIGHDGLPIGW